MPEKMPFDFLGKLPTWMNNWRLWLPGWFCVMFAVPLLGYMAMGSHMRLSGDDYCYAMRLTNSDSFWKAQIDSYLYETNYHSNRYMLTFFSNVSDFIGPRSSGAYPMLAVIGWVIGLSLSLHGIGKRAGWHLSSVEAVLLAEALVFFALYQTTALYEVLYWRAAMVGYLGPFVFNFLMLPLLFVQSGRPKFSGWIAAVLFIMAFIAGGGTETLTAVQFWLWVFAAVLLIAAHRRGSAEVGLRPALWQTGVVISATLLAILSLVLAPNTLRLMGNEPGSLNLFDAGIRSVRYALTFIALTFQGLPLPNAINFLLGFWVGLLSAARSTRHDRMLDLKIAAGAYLGGFVMIVSSIAPTVIAQGVYPSPRVLFVPGTILVALVALTGFTLGKTLHSLNIRRPLFPVITAALLIILSSYPVFATRKITAELPKFQRWSMLWDLRDQEIRLARAQGNLDIEVMELDHVIPNVSELNDIPSNWYNGCAAGYYRIHTIRAILPGWDE